MASEDKQVGALNMKTLSSPAQSTGTASCLPFAPSVQGLANLFCMGQTVNICGGVAICPQLHSQLLSSVVVLRKQPEPICGCVLITFSKTGGGPDLVRRLYCADPALAGASLLGKPFYSVSLPEFSSPQRLFPRCLDSVSLSSV